MKSIKKILIFIISAIIIICTIPIPIHYKDGGTVEYCAVLYQVWDYHAIDDRFNSGFFEGTVIKILGFEIFDSTPKQNNNIIS